MALSVKCTPFSYIIIDKPSLAMTDKNRKKGKMKN